MKKALLVGIDRYPSAPLQGCLNDVEDWHRLLTTEGRYHPDNIRVVCDDRATTQGIRNRMTWLREGITGPGDEVFFSFSGHGSQVRDRGPLDELADYKDEIICPFDLDWNTKVITDDDIGDWLKEFPKGTRIIVVLDCCLTGGTKIPLLDGTEPMIKELAERGGEFWVYSSNPNGKIVPGKAHSARLTRRAEIVRVVLDNGEAIECTEDHPFMLRDGSFKDAGKLLPGESLMPLYRKIGTEGDGYLNGYEMVRDMSAARGGRWVPTHKMVAGSLGISEKGSKRSITHHKNFNKRDNRPENLEAMTWHDHKRAHGEVGRKNLEKTWARSEYREWRRSEEYKKAQAERTQKTWNDSDHRVKRAEINRKRFERDGLSEKFKAYNFSDANKEHSAERHRPGGDLYEVVRRPENIERLRCMAHDPSVIQKIQQGRKEKFSDPNSDLYKSMHSPERADMCRLMNRYANLVRYGKIDKVAIPFKVWRETQSAVGNNHKVVGVERTGRVEDVYDLTVEEHHNFAVSAGVFVHNCHSGTGTREMRPPEETTLSYTSRYIAPPIDIALRNEGLPKLKGVEISNRIGIGRGRRGNWRKAKANGKQKSWFWWKGCCQRKTKPSPFPPITIEESSMNHVLISGCRSDQTSADALINGRYNGALSRYLIDTIRAMPGKSVQEIHSVARKVILDAGYTQESQLEGPDLMMKNKIFM